MSVINQEWLNQNSGRAYPLAEDSSRAPVQPSVMGRLPDYLIVDAVLTTPAGLPGVYGLSRVSVAAGNVVIGFRAGSDEAASAGFSAAAHTPGAAYRLTGLGAYSDVDGFVAVGDLARFAAEYPDGAYEFADGSAPLEPCVARPALRGVGSITVGGVSLSGAVVLDAGPNIVLRVDEGSKTIRVDAIPGAGYAASCPGGGTAVSTVNGIPASELEIVGDDCVEVVKSGSTLTITDKCSKPCCGCEELEFLREQYNQFASDVDALRRYASQIEANIESFKGGVTAALGGGV